MKKEIKNIPASIRSRLLNIAKATNRDFNAILLQYFQERFLYRLSLSEFKENLVLKGALLFRVYGNYDFRATRDIDFLGIKVSNDEDDLLKMIGKIISVKVSDGVWFDPESLESEIITKEAKYNGVRMFCIAHLGQVKLRLHFDVGFGDVIYPKATFRTYPVLLSDFPKYELISYPPETMVAEKFEIIVNLGFNTSRMKDFFDIYFIALRYRFDSTNLKKAIHETFANRKTDLNKRNEIYSYEFANNSTNILQWNAFVKRIKLEYVLSFQDCLVFIKNFIEPVLDCELNLVWDIMDLQWVKK